MMPREDSNVQYMEVCADFNQSADYSQPKQYMCMVMKEHSNDESDDPLYQLEVEVVNSMRQGSFLLYCRFRKQWRRQSYSVN